MNSPLTVTRDKNTNLRHLNQLEALELIKIFDVKIENQSQKIKSQILPVAVFNHTKWDEMVWAGEDCTYEEIRKIIGPHNIKDAIILEAHIRNGFDYFVTDDKDEFINNGRRELLEQKFAGLKIVTVEELKNLVTAN